MSTVRPRGHRASRAQALTPKEAARYEVYPRPIIERGEGVSRGATVGLWAVKP